MNAFQLFLADLFSFDLQTVPYDLLRMIRYIPNQVIMHKMVFILLYYYDFEVLSLEYY